MNCTSYQSVDGVCGTANGALYKNPGASTTDVINYFNTLQLCNPATSPTVTTNDTIKKALWSCAGNMY